MVSVYIPEYVVGHWYEHLLHNQSALRLKGRLLFTPGVMVTSVPYQLESSEAAKKRARKRAGVERPGLGPPRPGGAGAAEGAAGAEGLTAARRCGSRARPARPAA